MLVPREILNACLPAYSTELIERNGNEREKGDKVVLAGKAGKDILGIFTSFYMFIFFICLMLSTCQGSLRNPQHIFCGCLIKILKIPLIVIKSRHTN